MTSQPTFSAMMLLAVLFAFARPARADQEPAKAPKKLEPMEVRALLEQGQASGSLPEGLVIRVGCCLGERREKTSQAGDSEGLRETWEFTSKQVRRIRHENVEDGQGDRTQERVDSQPFDSKDICKQLLQGQAIEIQAQKGEGPEVAFVGTSYGRGSRSIEMTLNGETILDLLEINGPFLKVYRETDARAFGALHEQLASQARAVFKSKANEAKINK